MAKLTGKTIVFTGKLETMTRGEAAGAGGVWARTMVGAAISPRRDKSRSRACCVMSASPGRIFLGGYARLRERNFAERRPGQVRRLLPQPFQQRLFWRLSTNRRASIGC